MQADDLDAVLVVERRAYAFPWTQTIFADCLKAGYECRVACFETHIVGHAVLSCAAGEAHLLNICIGRDKQGQGFGRELVHHMLERAKLRGAAKLYLEVRPSNRVAIGLYESLGFAHVGTRNDYYPSELGREDALVLALPL